MLALSCALVIGLVPADPAAAACTQRDSEQKLHALVEAMHELEARDPGKVAEVRRKFDAALDRALQPSSDPDKATAEFCQALDALRTALRR